MFPFTFTTHTVGLQKQKMNIKFVQTTSNYMMNTNLFTDIIIDKKKKSHNILELYGNLSSNKRSM